MLLFGRKASLSIARSGYSSGGKKYADRIRTARTLSDLRIEATIKRTDKARPDDATISIYNIAPETRAMLEEDDAYVILRAGTGDGDPPIVFVGDVQDITRKRSGDADWVTTIEAGDGENAYNNLEVSMSLSGGSLVSDALDIMTTALGTAGIDVDRDALRQLSPIQLAQGYSFDGRMRDAMNELAALGGWAGWGIVDGALQVHETEPEPRAVVLSEETGLISPAPRLERDLWSFSSILQPGIYPRSIVKVESSEVNAFLRVETVEVSIDTHGDDWTINAQGRAYETVTA